MKSFRLRLDIGIGLDSISSPLQNDRVVSTKSVDIGGKSKHIRPVFEIQYDDQTTFVTVLREIIESQLLDGHLLDFLERNSSNKTDNGHRKELYVLIYSKEDATVVQPHWSSPLGPTRSRNVLREMNHQFMLLLTFGDGQEASNVVNEPDSLVSSFVEKYWKHFVQGKCNPKEAQAHGNKYIVDMVLSGKICQGYKPNNINILLCEEHWRQRGMLLNWTLMTTTKSAAALNINSSLVTGNNACAATNSEQRRPALKSFLIHDFLGTNNQLLRAMAFLIPTTLISRGLDTLEGIQLSVDKPRMSKVRTLNLERPAVLRQYFGMDLDSTDSDLPQTEREDVVWRSCYGCGSGSTSVGIHPRHSTTREMTAAMKIIADDIFQYLRARFKDDDSIVVERFNHVTVLFYYQKADPSENKERLNKEMLGYHTDNVFNHDGLFVQDSNSQLENTLTALLTLGDKRTLHFRRQEITNEKKRKWTSDDNTIAFSMKHGSLFLLHPHDERPTQTSLPDGPIQRYQHGHVKFPYHGKVSVALALRTVTSSEQVYKTTGKLFMEQPMVPKMLPPQSISNGNTNSYFASKSPVEPEVSYLLDKFREEKMITSDEKLKARWQSVCSRHFKYQMREHQNRSYQYNAS